MVLASLATTPVLAQEAAPAKPVWERPIELPSVGCEEPVDGSAFGVLKMVARPGGGAVVLREIEEKDKPARLVLMRHAAPGGG